VVAGIVVHTAAKQIIFLSTVAIMRLFDPPRNAFVAVANNAKVVSTVAILQTQTTMMLPRTG